jgi:hypothetical protein
MHNMSRFKVPLNPEPDTEENGYYKPPVKRECQHHNCVEFDGVEKCLDCGEIIDLNEHH